MMEFKKYMLLLPFLFWGMNRGVAQNNTGGHLPFVLNAAGGYHQGNNQLYDFNVGEMVLVNTFSTGFYLFSQGFLQPLWISGTPLNESGVTVDNNVMTPNGDGKNDFLVFRGLEKYPGNKLSIYDRAGRLMFSATDYKNNWDATINGKVLNEDSYYYVLDLGKDYALIKGFVSIILDKY